MLLSLLMAAHTLYSCETFDGIIRAATMLSFTRHAPDARGLTSNDGRWRPRQVRTMHVEFCYL